MRELFFLFMRFIREAQIDVDQCNGAFSRMAVPSDIAYRCAHGMV
jgi:hypothetical protein